ncbi:hypothetical protein [Paraliobacillus salinarum]|uniref:hypothetical protein n=1 Tax=Paraliobacillus salinarum TaxID=1158996 RepID=UPI0015F5349B|nr:hypothetical protein [Paraliobacillus salinarum]
MKNNLFVSKPIPTYLKITIPIQLVALIVLWLFNNKVDVVVSISLLVILVTMFVNLIMYFKEKKKG